mmetsp:Transcript_116359/g.181854  ORF Transcript_116359/g.181854 Transcript_116359/m.181854 type:complete len:83 (-) Transcript_116359:424-672(-)
MPEVHVALIPLRLHCNLRGHRNRICGGAADAVRSRLSNTMDLPTASMHKLDKLPELEQKDGTSDNVLAIPDETGSALGTMGN